MGSMNALEEAIVVAGDKLIDKAQAAGNFISVVVAVKDSQIQMEMMQHNFPDADYIHVAAQMTAGLSDLYRKTTQSAPDPLPEATDLLDRFRTNLADKPFGGCEFVSEEVADTELDRNGDSGDETLEKTD